MSGAFATTTVGTGFHCTKETASEKVSNNVDQNQILLAKYAKEFDFGGCLLSKPTNALVYRGQNHTIDNTVYSILGTYQHYIQIPCVCKYCILSQ